MMINIDRLRFSAGFLIFLLILANASIAPARANEEDALFGPVTVLRATGKPQSASYTFPKLPGFEEPFYLVVTNGDGNGRARISAASIFLNGALVLSPSDLNSKTGEVSLQVELADVNTLEAKVKSKPGSFLKVSVVGQKIEQPEQVLDQSSVTVGPGGGTAELKDFATVMLGENPLRPNLTLTLEKIISAFKTALHQSETIEAGPALPEILKITSSENITTPVAVAIQVPQAFIDALPQGYQVELFAEFTQIGSDEEVMSNFERLGATYDPVGGVAYANIPPYAFTPTNSVSTSIIVGSYQNAPTSQVTGTNIVPSQAVQAKPNDVLPLSADLSFSIPPQIGNPLHAAMTVTSHFGPRTHPVAGQPSFHHGIDLRTSSQPVYPVLPGRVVRSGPQHPCPIVVDGVCKYGLGHRVTIDHRNGLLSVYGHLEPDGLPAVGTEVGTNTQIGASDTTGTSTADHLHIEYRIDAARGTNGSAVDPLLFINQQDADGYLRNLSVVTLVNGVSVPATKRQVRGAEVVGNRALFSYSAQLDLVPLGLRSGSTNQLSIVLQNANETTHHSLNQFPVFRISS